MTRRKGQSSFVHQKVISSTCEVLYVSSCFTVDPIPHWFAYSQEVRPQSTDGVFGNVSQRLAGSGSKHAAPHSFVNAHHALLSQRPVLDTRKVNRYKFTADENYKSEGNHDSSKQLVGYGVVFVWVPDGLIVAVETPLEGVVFRGKNEKWKPNEDEAENVEQDERDG